MPDDKLPSIQFYPGDWKRDVGVQSLDYFTRGVWWELLQMMHASPRRGALVWDSEEPMDDAGIAQVLGISPQQWSKTKSVLLSRGVASVEPDSGALCNRRMLRDEGLRKAKIRAGREGGKQKASRHPSKAVAKRGSSSSSSSSPSASASAGSPPTPPGGSRSLARGRQQPESPEARAAAIQSAYELAEELPEQSADALKRYAGFLESRGEVTGQKILENCRTLFNNRQAMETDAAIPVDRVFAYGIDEAIKAGVVSPVYAGKASESEYQRMRDGCPRG